MKLQKRIAALALALTMALAAGCSTKDTSWVAQSGEDTIPAGVYLVELMMGYNDAQSQASGAGDILKQSIGDIPAPQYITDFAKSECAKLLAIRKEFQTRGLTLSDEDRDQAASYTDYLYSMGEELYKGNGVAKESVQYINETSMMSLEVFNNIYGEGGEKGVPKAELEKEFAGKYTRSQYILFPKVDTATGAPLNEDELQKNKEKAESYLARAQAGESFPSLSYEQAKELNPDGAGEQMADNSYDVYLENSAGFYPPVYEETILKAQDNEILMVEDDYYFYVLKKLPILGGDEEKVKTHLDAILQNMKYDEYMEGVGAWSQEMEIRYNTAALAAYTPAKLKMTEEQLSSSSSSSSESGSSSESSSSQSGSSESNSASSESGSGSSASPSGSSESNSASGSSAS